MSLLCYACTEKQFTFFFASSKKANNSLIAAKILMKKNLIDSKKMLFHYFLIHVTLLMLNIYLNNDKKLKFAIRTIFEYVNAVIKILLLL